MNDRIYVTGAAGAIGRELVPRLARRGVVIALDRAAAPMPEAGWYDPAESNAAIVHLANAFHARAPGDAVSAAAEQIELFHRLADRGWRGHLVFLSSAAVYAGSADPIPETAPPAPPNPYGAQKLAVERGLTALAAQAGFALSILRVANVYGTPLDLARGRVGALLIAAARGGTPFRLYGDGSSQRDYLHIRDLCRAVEAALERRPALCNIGGGTGTPLRDLIALVERITGRAVPLEHHPAQAEAAASVMDVGRAAAELGWRAEVPLARGMAELAAVMAR